MSDEEPKDQDDEVTEGEEGGQEIDESGYDESVEGNGTHEEQGQAAEASLNTYVGEQS